MAFPTAVNSQITDAVTQSNVKAVGEAPALAMGAIYQNLAQSTGILFENAVAAQQQMNTIAQAATNQGVMQIYSIDTAATSVATDKIEQVAMPDHMTSLLTVLNALQSTASKTDAVDPATLEAVSGDAKDAAKAADDYPHLNAQIKDAVRFTNDTVLGHADTLNSGLRQCTDSFVHAIRQVQDAQEAALRRTLLDAAMTATLKAMLQAPQRAKEYEEVLQVIKRLE